MTTQTVSSEVARRETGAEVMVRQYEDSLAQVMPSHIRPETWVRLAVGVLHRDEKLAEAANNNIPAFISALMHAARLGLEPGTEQFYLVPRKNKSNRYLPEIQGMPGYQGIVELMYRAGAVSSVNVEVVRDNDAFIWVPGKIDNRRPPRWEGPMKQPYHEADWFSDRGALKGVYAYATMRDGAISKVVVLNRQHIAHAKSKSDGASGDYSPWRTDEEAMWLKTAARRLSKWVPTSAEYLAERLRAVNGGAPASIAVAAVGTPVPDVDFGNDGTELAEGEFVHDHEGDYDSSCSDCRLEVEAEIGRLTSTWESSRLASEFESGAGLPMAQASTDQLRGFRDYLKSQTGAP
jgi:recombination protein RecT